MSEICSIYVKRFAPSWGRNSSGDGTPSQGGNLKPLTIEDFNKMICSFGGSFLFDTGSRNRCIWE